MQQAQSRKEKFPRDARNPSLDRKAIMSEHGHLWKELSFQEQQMYEIKATSARSSATEVYKRIREDTIGKICTRETEVRDSKEVLPKSMMMSACHLNAAQREKLETLHASEIFTKKLVSKLRDSANGCPEKLADEVFNSYCAMGRCIFNFEHTQGSRLKTRIGRCRNHLMHKVLAKEEGTTLQFYYFLFAALQPVTLYLMPLQANKLQGPHLPETFKDLQLQPVGYYEYAWTYDTCEYNVDMPFQDDELDQWFIIPHAVCKASTIIVSNASMCTLEEFLLAAETELKPRSSNAPGTQREHVVPRARGQAAETRPEWLNFPLKVCLGLQSSSSAAQASVPPLVVASDTEDDD
eukprot:6469114-Amphidinium_carterae.1